MPEYEQVYFVQIRTVFPSPVKYVLTTSIHIVQLQLYTKCNNLYKIVMQLLYSVGVQAITSCLVHTSNMITHDKSELMCTNYTP